MPKATKYTAQEDLLLAESMFEVRRKYRGCPSESFRFRFPQVYKLFIRKRLNFGIAGGVRSQRSIQSRIYHIREAYRKGQLRRFRHGDEAICSKWHDLWTAVLENEFSPTKHHTSRNGGASRSHFQAGVCEKGQELPNHLDERPGKYQRQQLSQQRQKNAKSLLDALTKNCNERAKIERIREETLRKQEQLAQDQRNWKKKMLSTLIQQSTSDDNEKYSAFLQSLEDIAEKNAELNRLREESAAERTENDRENWEWERDAYEDLLAQYVDKHNRC